MKNYEYIIASLPVLQHDLEINADDIIDSIKEQLDRQDEAIVDFFLSAFDPETELNIDFYTKASKHSNSFINKYFDFDLHLRNIKVEYLNHRLERPNGQDMVFLNIHKECEYKDKIMSVLHIPDILRRERGLDDLVWQEIDEYNLWDYFNLDLILGFIAKLKIIDRWNKLNPETGKKLFRKLVNEIRATYDNKKQNII